MSTAISTPKHRAQVPFYAHLAPISLDELIAQAAMLTRIDRKYVLHRDELPAALGGLDPHTKVLMIGGKAPQPYRSIYFDTEDHRSFYLAAHKRRRKFKVRTRTYVDSATSFLEVKAKGSRGVTVKERIPYDKELADKAILDDTIRGWLEEQLVKAGQPKGISHHLEASMWGTYNRTTLLMADGSGRATIDTELDWACPGRYIERPDMVIVETKSGSRPSQIDRLLWASGHRPARISKFGTGMAALNESLPHNNWNRVLNEYFWD